MAEVGAVVVTYRSRDHVGPCLESLRAERRAVPLDAAVVDNGSDDGTAAFVREGFPWARVIANADNRGFAAAANQGAAAVRGDLILFLNPDAALEPGCLAALVAALDAHPAAALASPRLVAPDGSAWPSAWLAPGFASLAFEALLLHNVLPSSPLHSLAAPPGSVPREVPCVSGACLLVRRADFERLGGFDERFFMYYEDFDLCLRAAAQGRRALLVPAARSVHARGGSAFRDRRAFLRRFHASRRAFLAKHHRGPSLRLLQAASLAGVALRVAANGVAAVLGSEGRRSEAAAHAALLRDVLAGRL